MKDEKCIECKWCDPDPANIKQGLCRLRPPTAAVLNTPQGVVTMATWPPVKLTIDRCGSFERELVKVASVMPRGKKGRKESLRPWHPRAISQAH